MSTQSKLDEILKRLGNIEEEIVRMKYRDFGQPYNWDRHSLSIRPQCNCYTQSSAACPIHTISGGVTAG